MKMDQVSLSLYLNRMIRLFEQSMRMEEKTF